MRLFSGDMFINLYKQINHDEFYNEYHDHYTIETFKLIYVAANNIVPLELNMNGFRVPCNYGDSQSLSWERRPLIEMLYRSDKVIKMIEKLITEFMMSSVLYVNMCARSSFGQSSSHLRRFNLANFYPSWNEDDFSITSKIFKSK